MPGPKPEPIELSDKARLELEKLVARHTTGQQKALGLIRFSGGETMGGLH